MRCISLEQSPPKNAFSVSEISSEEQVDERALLKQIRLQQNIFTQPVKKYVFFDCNLLHLYFIHF